MKMMHTEFQGSTSLVVMVTPEEKFFFFEEMRSRTSEPYVWVEVCVEVDEQVERLVRHTHVRNEDGSFRQLGRVVIGSVPKGNLVLLFKICWICRTSCARGCVQSISCCQGCQ